MTTVRVRRVAPAEAIERGRRTTPESGDYAEVVRGPCVIEDERGPVCIVSRYIAPTSALLAAVERIACPTVERSGALVVATRVWGRVPAGDATRQTALMRDAEAAEVLRDYARELGRLYREATPRAWAVQSQRVGRSALTVGAPWTTGSINRATATAYHRDSRNLPRARSGMLVLRGEGVEGGALVLPELRVALDLRDGDVLLFDGAALWHGNEALTVPAGSWRYSLPCYAMTGV